MNPRRRRHNRIRRRARANGWRSTVRALVRELFLEEALSRLSVCEVIAHTSVLLRRLDPSHFRYDLAAQPWRFK